MRHRFFDLPLPTVVGHRGAAGERPENTLASFAHALATGAHVLESDVHQTRDGALVLIHDEVVDRITEGTGRVADLDLADVQKLDAGHRFQLDGDFPFRGQGLRIPTLEEALDEFPDARFNLELKERLPGLVEGAVALVERKRAADRVLLAAGHPGIMADLRQCLGDTGVAVAQGASAADIVGFVRAALDQQPPPVGPMALQVPVDFGGRPLVTAALVAHAHAHDVAVHVWTVNDPDEMNRLFDLGVDGIISDFPGRVAEVIEARGE